MKHGFLLASAFVFYTNALLASAAQAGSSPNDLPLFGCELLKTIPNGNYKLDDIDIEEDDYFDENIVIRAGSEVIFQCDFGHVLLGQSKVLCKGNNQWEPALPKCQVPPSGCKLPKNFPRGSYSVDEGEIEDNEDYEHNWIPGGFAVNFKCDPDYRLIGPTKVLCETDNQWESDLPRCLLRYCNNPPSTDGGYWKRARKDYARLVCNEGYVLKNPKVSLLKCVEVNQTERDWRHSRGDWPTCIKRAVCPDPGSPAPGTGNRTGDGGPFYENSTVSIECEEDFELVGQKTIRCQKDSTWDFPRARCKPEVTCEDIPDDPHRILNMTYDSEIFDYYVPGNTLEASCVPGFRPNTSLGNPSIVCDSSGLWDDNITVCYETWCSSPELPKDGDLINGNEDGRYKHNTEIRYRCKHGYRLFGFNWNQCTDSGWKHKTPQCEEVTCVDPGSPENGKRHASSSNFQVNSTVTFSCFDGYKLIGSAERKCMSNGQWDGTLAICTPKRSDGCPNPGVPMNGLRSGTKSSNYHAGDVATFRCNPGFTMEGSASRTCQHNGLWDGEEPLCRGRYDVDRPEEVKFRLLDELDTELALQDTQYGPLNGSAVVGNKLDVSIKNKGGHLIFYFVFDSSDSVGKDNFQTSIKFATALIRRVGVSDHVHVGLVTYGSTAKRILSPFDNTMEIVMTTLSNITYLGGGTATKAAIKMVREMVVSSQRIYTTATKSIVFLVTDGLHNVGGNPEEEAVTLKEMGVEIFVIGLVGHKNINRNSMTHLATSGDKHVYYTAGYETMEYLVDELLTDTVDYSHCGISVRNISDNDAHGRIHGGVITTIHWPWMVHFAIRKFNTRKQVFIATCGGSIIENSWILSAAHCFDGVHIDNVTATAGVLNLDLDNDGDRQTRSVERIWRHPRFNSTIYDYDLALVKLKTPLQYGKYIRRICLPPNFSEIEKNSSLYRQNEAAIVIGFGVTEDGVSSNELKEIDILIQNKTTCVKSIGDHDAQMTEQMMCAGDPEGKKDACKGDSGGPLMQEVFSESTLREPYWIQVGVVSWSVKGYCGKRGFYGFYTHLAKLKDSVVQEIKRH